MNATFANWLVIGLALAAANWPFVSRRFLGVRLDRDKGLGLHGVELIVGYFVVGLAALAIESGLGQRAPQGWEFYAITGTLFVTLAFPGFVYRYLYKART